MNESKFSKRQLVVVGLFLFALFWVLLMGIADAVGGSSTSSAAAPGISGRSSAAARASFPRDGNLSTKVTSVDCDKGHVTLTLNVTDKDGKVQRDLTDKDFEIYENGILAKVLKFTPAGSTGVRVGLAVDYAGNHGELGPDQRELILAGTRSLVNALHEGSDHFGLYLNNHHALTNNYREAVPMGPVDASRRDQAVKRLDNLRQFYSGSGIIPTMGIALSKLAETRGRRVLIVMTAGWDDLAIHARNAPTKDQQTEFLEKEKKAIGNLISDAQKFGIPIYMVYPVGTIQGQDEVMKRVGNESGGEYYAAVGTAKLTEYLIGVTEALRNEYSLEYDSPNPKEDGTQRKVNVVIRSATSGANTAEGGYRMPGVLASESSSTNESATTPGAATTTKKSSVPVFRVFFPLLVLLLVLFAVPYLLWLMPRGRGDQEAPAAAPPAPAAVAVAASATPKAPVAVLVSAAKTPPPAQGGPRAAVVLPKVVKPLPKSNNNVPISKPAPGAKRPPGR